jgi:hypothetical protein
VALDWEQTKKLMRLQATAEQIAAAAKAAVRTREQAAAAHQLDALIAQVEDLLHDADDILAEEFEAVAGERTVPGQVHAQANAVFGWIKGATEAETFEARVQAEAEALAKERVRTERKPGFA